MIKKSPDRLPLEQAYAFGRERGLAIEIESIQKMIIPRVARPPSVRRGFIIALFEQREIFDEFKTKFWISGDTEEGQKQYRLYLRRKNDFEDAQDDQEQFDDDDSEDVTVDGEPAPREETYRFALEAHLRDFLARKPDCIESGLRVYHADGVSGVEFQIDGGRIDLLAIDRNDRFVVIELKLSLGRNKALGQLLYYMSWVDKNLGAGPCRGFIIANEISPELSLAALRASGVTLASYRMQFEIEQVRP